MSQEITQSQREEEWKERMEVEKGRVSSRGLFTLTAKHHVSGLLWNILVKGLCFLSRCVLLVYLFVLFIYLLDYIHLFI
jgi:hypothetical protein